MFFVPKKGVFRVEYTCQSDVMYKSLKSAVGFFGELGHGADPRAHKKLCRLPAVILQRIKGQSQILNAALVLILDHDLALALDHGRRAWP